MRRIALGLLVSAALAPAVSGEARADARPAIVVTPGAAQTFRVALQEFRDTSTAPPGADARAFRQAVAAALEYSGVFELVDPDAFLGPRQTEALDDDKVLADCPNWSQIGSDALVQGLLRVEAGQLGVDFRVWDATRCTRVLAKRYRQASGGDAGLIAKRVADDVVAAFTGVRGVSSTEIAFVSDRGGNPEVYVMDADGGNARPATANRSINKFPAWSPTGDAILYTSYRHLNRPALFVTARGNGIQPGRLLPSLGPAQQQYRGVFGPSGNELAVVIKDDGPPEIYRVRADGSRLSRLTRNRVVDISPSWSPDGSKIAFVSDRSGTPQVYVMDADGGGVRRLTYNGDYNTNPAWSPDGRWIAYDTRVGGQFDIWLIDPEGRVNVPLVTHPRSDESPAWAPDSRKLAFSSTRRGRADIYVVDVNGENLRRITRNAGDNTSPAWSTYPP